MSIAVKFTQQKTKQIGKSKHHTVKNPWKLKSHAPKRMKGTNSSTTESQN